MWRGVYNITDLREEVMQAHHYSNHTIKTQCSYDQTYLLWIACGWMRLTYNIHLHDSKVCVCACAHMYVCMVFNMIYCSTAFQIYKVKGGEQVAKVGGSDL